MHLLKMFLQIKEKVLEALILQELPKSWSVGLGNNVLKRRWQSVSKNWSKESEFELSG